MHEMSAGYGPLREAQLDDLLREVLSRVEGALDEKDRQRLLLDAVVTMAADLTLDSVLARIVGIAGALVDAQYAALGVLGGARGARLRTFIHHGVSDETAAEIGDLPTGHGLLGLIIDRPEPLRLHDIAEHPESSGFPAHHPLMESFLGVPVRIRGRVFGNLYLTQKAGGGDFTAQDEEIVVALAAAAGVVIENARLYEEAHRREQWLGVTAEITSQITGALAYGDALQVVADRARQVAAADAAWIVSGGGGADVTVHVSAGDAVVFPDWLNEILAETTAAVATEAPEPAVDSEADDDGPAIAVPLGVDHAGRELVLALGWTPERSDVFHEVAVAQPESFAKQAGLALEVARARETSQRVAVLEDRDRIGRDLHDLVIQRLFGVCLSLESTSRQTEDATAAERLGVAVDDLDATIKDIRRTIFALGAVGNRADIQSEITRMVDKAAMTLDFRPTLRFDGPVRSLVSPDLAPDLLAVLGEAISNATRHAACSELDVLLEAGERVVLTVTDNGRGMPVEVLESGMSNMRHRARARGGTFVVGAGPHGGTRLVWAVPISAQVSPV